MKENSQYVRKEKTNNIPNKTRERWLPWCLGWNQGSLLLLVIVSVMMVQSSNTATEGARDDCVSDLHVRQRVKISGELLLLDPITDGGGWRVFQRRSKGNTDFFETWENYKYGFGNIVTKDFWLGLEKIHDYCGHELDYCELRIDMVFKNRCYHATYGIFYIDDEKDNYRLHARDYNGTAGNSLIIDNLEHDHNNISFTTKDRDNDACENCNSARAHFGGWWYKDLGSGNIANLNGIWNSKVHGEGMNWLTLTHNKDVVTYSEMKMRKGCHKGFVPGPKKEICYRLVRTPTTWRDAQAHCERMGYGRGGTLAQAKTSQQNTAIASLQGDFEIWIGGNGVGSSQNADGSWKNNGGVWMWGKERMEWTNWLYSTYPVNNKNCTAMMIAEDHNGDMRGYGVWRNKQCDTKLYYVCQHLIHVSSGKTKPSRSNYVENSSAAMHVKSYTCIVFTSLVVEFAIYKVFHMYMD